MISVATEDARLPMHAGEVYHRDYELSADVFVRVQVEQQGIDVALRLVGPEAEGLIDVDSPTGASGVEELAWISESSGTYSVEVAAASTGPAGAIIFRTLAQRAASATDRDFVTADAAFRRGRELVERAGWNEAKLELRASLGTWIEQGRSRREADTRYWLGRAHAGAGENELATVALERAFGLYRDTEEYLLAAVTAGRLGALRQATGHVELALGDFEVARAGFRRLGYSRGVGLMASRLGSGHFLVGDLRRSMECFDEAIESLENDRASDQELATVLVNSGGVYLALNRPRDAQQRFERAERLFRQQGDTRGLAQSLVRTANVAFRLGEVERARQLVGESIVLLLGLSETIGTEAQRDLAAARLLLGRQLKRARRLGEANAVFSEALATTRRIDDPQAAGALLLELGHLRLLEGQETAALHFFEEARELIASAGDRTGEAMAQVRSAQALGALGRHHEALENLAPALVVAESLRVASDRPDVRTDYFAFRQEYFEVAVDLSMQLHALEPQTGHHIRALETHERRRSRTLLDSLVERPTKSRSGVRPALLVREESLEEEIRRSTRTGTTVAEETVTSLLEQLRAVRGEIRAEERATPLAEREPTPIGELQENVLGPNALALVYALGSEKSYLWAVSRADIEVYELPKRALIESQTREFMALLPALGKSRIARRQRAGRQLSEWLLAPVAERLNGQLLVVVPTGALQLLSFSALPFPDSAHPGDYLVRHHPLATVPSLTTLVELRRRAGHSESAKRGIAAFGDPVFSPEDERVRRPSLSEGVPRSIGDQVPVQTREQRLVGRLGDVFGFGFERLEFSAVEVDSIARLEGEAGSLIATGFEANLDTFRQQIGSGHRILHFATHSFQNPTHPELSSLVLSLVDETGKQRDGLLSVFEIARLDLPAEMVVLSACRTGLGQRAAGEGIMGLTRAFFDAGTRTVVSSLWSVDDRSTATLMINLYRYHLQQGLEPTTALQRAQLDALEHPDSAHPHHWAGFVLQGDWAPTNATQRATGQHEERTMTEQDKAPPDLVGPGTDPFPTPDDDPNQENPKEDQQRLAEIAERELQRRNEET